MAGTEQTSEDRSNGDVDARTANHSVWLGPVIVFAGAISYFLVFARFPVFRDFPWVNLPVVFAGLLMSAIGLRRAFDPTRGSLAKIVASGAFLLSLALTLLFNAYIFYISYQLPEQNDVAQVLTTAPDFALPDHNEDTINLSDFRGRKVVVVFYRGYW